MEEAWTELLKRYEELRSKHCKDAWRYISQFFENFRLHFKELYLQSERAQRKKR